MASRISIKLQKFSFYPGETIIGEAMCYFRSPKEFRKIRIRLQGEERTHWTKRESYRDAQSNETRYRNVGYHGRNDVVLIDNIAHGPGSLPSGEYRFAVNFQLPYSLPSSYHCEYGRISYSVKLTVDRAYKTDLEESVEFRVFAPIRLDELGPDLLVPVELYDEKTVCRWCCTAGNIELKVELDDSAFAVGHTKNINVYVLNMSNINTRGLEVELRQKISCEATSPARDHKTDSEYLARARCAGVGAHGDRTYIIPLAIPETSVVPNFNNADLFQANYKLKVSLVLSGCHSNLEVTSYVAVGHIPRNAPPIMHVTPPQMEPKRAGSWLALNEETDGFFPQQMPMPIRMPMPMPMPVHLPVAMPMPMPTYMPEPSQGCSTDMASAPLDECSAPPLHNNYDERLSDEDPGQQ